MKEISIYLGEDSIYTNSTGIKQLLGFYDQCKEYNDCLIDVKLDHLLWLDGNLSSLLGALLFRLKKDNNLIFKVDAAQVSEKCNILFHNNFLPVEQDLKLYKKDSCIPFMGFYPKQKDEFTDYLENEVLGHASMPKFSSIIKEKLIDDLIEVYGNIDKHADTKDPFFVCGQHFRLQQMVRFTICDLGNGFYKKIQELKPELIKNDGDALLWAIKGNSTKPDAPGGKGLENLHQYFREFDGGMQIFSGNTNWCSKTMEINSSFKPQGLTVLKNKFTGSCISLEFNKKTLLSSIV